MKRSTLILCGVVAAVTVVACQTSRAGYETAAFTAVKTDGTFEVRDYPELSVALTRMDGQQKDRDGRFMRLFRYIEGNNEGEKKIAMTTPVFMTRGDSPGMSFVLPQKVAESGAPAPKDSDVTVQKLPAQRCAVHRFTGLQSAKNEDEALAKLRSWMAEQKLEAAGEPFFAYYDPPWTPGPLRKNEVLIPVKKP